MMDIQEFAQRFHNITLADHQLGWVDFLETAGPKCMLLAPRGHGKTTVLNQIWLSWLIANNPQLRILLISHSKQKAEEFSLTIRNIMDNPELQQEFNLQTGTPWRADSWRLTDSPHSKPTLTCKGAMGRMTGWRGDIVIFDDLLEAGNISSEVTREKIIHWIKTEVFFALDPGPNQRIIVVGTRKHIDDWYGEILLNPDFVCKVDRAILADGSVLWPERYPMEELESIKNLNGALYFAQEMMNEPAPPEGLMFKYEWLRFYEHLPSYSHMLRYYMGIDPSHGSTAKKSSWFALCIIAHDRVNNKIYVCDFYRNKMSPEEQVQKSIEYAEKYNLTAIYVEAVFKYTHVYEGMRERFHNVYPIDYIHTKLKGTSVVAKEERIKNICSPPIELGKVYFKEPSKDQYTKMFIEHEYVAFPLGDFDMFDALTLAIHRVAGLRYDTDQPFFFPDT